MKKSVCVMIVLLTSVFVSAGRAQSAVVPKPLIAGVQVQGDVPDFVFLQKAATTWKAVVTVQSTNEWGNYMSVPDPSLSVAEEVNVVSTDKSVMKVVSVGKHEIKVEFVGVGQASLTFWRNGKICASDWRTAGTTVVDQHELGKFDDPPVFVRPKSHFLQATFWSRLELEINRDLDVWPSRIEIDPVVNGQKLGTLHYSVGTLNIKGWQPLYIWPSQVPPDAVSGEYKLLVRVYDGSEKLLGQFRFPVWVNTFGDLQIDRPEIQYSGLWQNILDIFGTFPTKVKVPGWESHVVAYLDNLLLSPVRKRDFTGRFDNYIGVDVTELLPEIVPGYHSVTVYFPETQQIVVGQMRLGMKYGIQDKSTSIAVPPDIEFGKRPDNVLRSLGQPSE